MSVFKFKHFLVNQSASAMKIGTDAMVFGALIAAEGKSHALDIGTGTGVLSLMAAQKNPGLQIKAIEIEEKAFQEAALNFSGSDYCNQLQAIHGDFIDFDFSSQFDLIFSNPPYFENSSKSGAADRNLARHDESLPLKLLFSKVSKLLSDDGHFWLILPNLTMDQYVAEAAENQLYPEIEFFVYGKEKQLVRKVVVFGKTRSAVLQKKLVIRNEDGSYTDQYKELTKDYHFNVLK